jgi:hypothetical protein
VTTLRRIVAVGAVAVVCGCSGGGSTSGSAPSSSPTPASSAAASDSPSAAASPSATSSAPSTKPGIAPLIVHIRNFHYLPPSPVVRVGQPITGFTKAGSYKFLCFYHADFASMNGVATAKESP